MINALLTGLTPPRANENFHITRATLDFLISHMRIKDNVNDNTERVKLGKSVILLFNQRDYATINKIPNWFFDHFVELENEEDVPAEDPAIVTIVESLKELFELSYSPEKQAASPLLR